MCEACDMTKFIRDDIINIDKYSRKIKLGNERFADACEDGNRVKSEEIRLELHELMDMYMDVTSHAVTNRNRLIKLLKTSKTCGGC